MNDAFPGSSIFRRSRWMHVNDVRDGLLRAVPYVQNGDTSDGFAT